MTGFNMPPGVSPRDIPGFDEPSLSKEEERSSILLESVRDLADSAHEEVLKIISNLSGENTQLMLSVDNWKQQAEHYKNYAQHHPSCTKVFARLKGSEGQCSCGLEIQE